MCLLLVSYKNHPKYKLIIAANRDEFYNRPAEPAKFWNDYPNLLAGRDLEAGGTWLGITKKGRFAAITNYRDLKNIKREAPSRGELVTRFLTGNDSPRDFSEDLMSTAGNYNGYNLLYSDLNEFYYFSNQTKKAIRLEPGTYGLSNHLLDTPWHKVEKSKRSFKDNLKAENINANDLFEILSDTSIPKDEDLPDTGLELEIERAVAPVFVSTALYGTRSSTVILMDMDNHITFIEKSFMLDSKEWDTVEFSFILES